MTTSPLQIIPIDTPSLGDRSYLVHDGHVAFVVDPQRDIDRMLELAQRSGVTISRVFETHIHNDYITGGYALAQATGAAYHVNAHDPVAFKHAGIAAGDLVDIGPRMRLQAVATPGHTFTHLSYVLEDERRPIAAFTGGSLLYGSVGRPDLLGPAYTSELVRDQYASARRLATLPDHVAVYPTHGFGSFCSAIQSDATASTIGNERWVNPVLTQDEQTFVDQLLAGLDAWPAYYTHMAPANLAGPTAPDLSPPHRADADELRARLTAGEWVVDLRHRVAFAAGHLPGAINIGMDGSFATYLGWLIPWGTPLTLLGESPEQIAEAQRELFRIGIDRLAGAATGEPSDWAGRRRLASFPRATFADLLQVRHHRDIVILDVRRRSEWKAAHLPSAINIPLHELVASLGEVPHREVWVHCEAGYRATIAASLLEAAGRSVVTIDDEFSSIRPEDLAPAFPEAS